MRFMVVRTSLVYRQHEQPCDEAQLEPYAHVDERPADDPRELPSARGIDPSWWYGKGSNHRVEGGRIKRDFDAEGWFVHFDTLDEFVAFILKHGECVVGLSPQNGDIVMIEIYDNYRE